ncbi:MAG: hypothetical protein L3K14_00235 [Thermoplasmata archaeon]|nr:hypothetical protein [Thermoplasmata archaeon]
MSANHDSAVPLGRAAGAGVNRWMLILQRRPAARRIVVKLSIHALRRSGATLLERTLLRSPEASRDGVYRTVQGFLRHENIATRMRYLEPDPSCQAAAMRVIADELPWGEPAAGRSEANDRPANRSRRTVTRRTARRDAEVAPVRLSAFWSSPLMPELTPANAPRVSGARAATVRRGT